MDLKPMIQRALVILIVPMIFLSVYAEAFPRELNLFNMGMRAARKGNLERAAELWSKVIDSNPGSYAAMVNRGVANMKRGFVIKGIDDWRKAVDLAPIFAFQTDCGDYVQGFKGNGSVNFVRPLEIDPDHVASVMMAGALCLDLGKHEEAISLFSKSIELTKNPLLKNRLDHWAKSLSDYCAN